MREITQQDRNLTNISLIHIDEDSFYGREFEAGENDTNQLIENAIDKKENWFSYFSDTGIFGTSFNFINSIIGSGVIGMAYSISLSGIGMSFLLLPLVAILTDYSILILINTGEKAGVKTYQDLVNVTIGRFGTYFLVLAQFLYPFIGLISYNIIIGDTITKVAMRTLKVSTTSILSNRQFIILMSSLFVTLPLSLYKNISKLAKTSFLSCVLLLFIFAIMINRYFLLKDYLKPTANAWKFVNNYEGVVDSFSIMAFGFMCHHNSFLIYHSMEKPTYKNWKAVSHISISFSVLISFLFGLVGYLTFTNLTEGDIFENYCYKDDLINIARLAYAIIIMFSFPLEAFVCRDVLINTFFEKRKNSSSLHTLITITIITFSVLFSFLTNCLGVVLELNGALIATNLAYIMPSLCAIFYCFKYERKITNFLIPSFICLLGFVIIISGLVSIIDKISSGYSCFKGLEFSYCDINTYNITLKNKTHIV